jgi:hypothetical protein
MVKFRHQVAAAAILLIGGGLYGAVLLSSVTQSGKLLVWAIIPLLIVGLLAYGSYRLVHPTTPAAVFLVTPPVFMTASAFLYILLAESRFGRYGAVFLAVVLAAIYFDNLRTSSTETETQRDDLVHLAFLLDLVGFYFLLAFVFGIQQFYSIPIVIMATVAAAAGALVVAGNFQRSGIDSVQNNRTVIFLSLLTAELYVALSFLPVQHLVDAAVTVVLVATAVQLARQVLSGSFDALNVRRDLIVSIVLSAVLLATARWI